MNAFQDQKTIKNQRVFDRISTRICAAALVLVLLLAGTGFAQRASKIIIGGIASTTAWLPGDAATPLSSGGTYPTLNNRFILLFDFEIDEALSAFASLESYQGNSPVFYAIGLNWRLSKSPDLLLRAGKFPAPFGNFLPRRYDSENALIGRPLAYFYQHNLSATVVPESYDELLQTRGSGSGNGYSNTQQNGEGMRFFGREAYISGLQLLGQMNRLRYGIAVTNGAFSTSANTNHSDRFNIAGHVQYMPMLGLQIGASFSSGAYLETDEASYQTGYSYKKTEDYRQTLVGADLSYSAGHLELWGEFLRNSYGSPYLIDKLGTNSWSAEAKYKINARIYLAGRWSTLLFDNVPDENDVDSDGATRESWDYDVSQLELGFGYRIHRNGYAKLTHRLNRTHDAPNCDPADDVTALQLVVFF